MDPSSDVKYEWRSVKYTRIFQGFRVGRSNRPMEYEVRPSKRSGMPKTKAVSRGGDLVVRKTLRTPEKDNGKPKSYFLLCNHDL